MPRAPQTARPRRRSDDTRPAVYARPGYGADWKRARNEKLRDTPYCETCGAPATQVDHVLPVSRGGDHQQFNLRSSCQSCHSRKTAKYDGGFGNRKKGACPELIAVPRLPAEVYQARVRVQGEGGSSFSQRQHENPRVNSNFYATESPERGSHA